MGRKIARSILRDAATGEEEKKTEEAEVKLTQFYGTPEAAASMLGETFLNDSPFFDEISR